MNNVTRSDVYESIHKIVKESKNKNNILNDIKETDGSYIVNYSETKREILMFNFLHENYDEYVYKNSKLNKACAYDNVNCGFIKMMYNLNPYIFWSIFNYLCKNGTYPSFWKIAKGSFDT